MTARPGGSALGAYLPNRGRDLPAAKFFRPWLPIFGLSDVYIRKDLGMRAPPAGEAMPRSARPCDPAAVSSPASPSPASPSPPCPARSLLIALSLGQRLARTAVCRLALDPAAWLGEANPAAAAARLGLPVAQVAKARQIARDAVRLAAEEEARAAALGCLILTRLDDGYPPALAQLALPPPLLYLRGRPEALARRPSVAVVGARRMDGYGREAARHFAGALARAGVVVVSGFAIGIDSAAHDAALEEGGATVAVLGCGLDVDYPAGSRGRAAAIAEKGALITELPLGTPPRPLNFPIRNRLIAALAEATLVIEARLRSGSLSTAGHALELGRDVYAVPGRIFDELASGTNRLIADGAHPALGAADLLERLGIAAPAVPPAGSTAAASPRAPAFSDHPLLAHLARTRDGMVAEDLADAVGQPLEQVLGALLELELAGRVDRRPGPVYVARDSSE